MKKIGYILLIIILLACFVGVFVFINQDKLIDRFIAQRTASAQLRTELLDRDNSIKLVTVGTGSPLPGDRVMSCNAVFVNGKFFLFDVGDGAARALEQFRLPVTHLDGIFITHWHDDHYMDLPEVINRSWLRGRQKELFVYGPDPLDSIMQGVQTFLHIDRKFRLAHHGEALMDTSVAHAHSRTIDLDGNESIVVYDDDGVVITAIAVKHEPIHPSLGYRIDFNGKSLVISGDTDKSSNLIKHAVDADILLHEALAFDFIERAEQIQIELGHTRNAQILKDIRDYHTNPVEAAEVAHEANVKKLILTHLGPAPENPISRTFYTRGMSEIFSGSILLAEDGDLFVIE